MNVLIAIERNEHDVKVGRIKNSTVNIDTKPNDV